MIVSITIRTFTNVNRRLDMKHDITNHEIALIHKVIHKFANIIEYNIRYFDGGPTDWIYKKLSSNLTSHKLLVHDRVVEVQEILPLASVNACHRTFKNKPKKLPILPTGMNNQEYI